MIWKLANSVLGELRTLNKRLHEDRQSVQLLLSGGRPEQIGREVRQSIDPLVREVSRTGGVLAGLAGEITSALGQTRAVAQQISASSTSMREIAGMFGEATRDLRLSQEQLQQALRQLAQPGALPEWLGQLHETVGPLRAAGAQIGQHYQHNRDLLDTTQLLLNSWNERGEDVVVGARTISDAFQQWSSEEAQARQFFNNQLDLRLEEVGRTIGELTTGLNNLNHTVNRLARASEAMQQSSDVSRAALNQLLDHQISNQEQQQRAVETLGALSHTIARHEERLGEQLGLLVQHSRSISEESGRSQLVLQKQQTEAMRGMVSQIAQMTSDLTIQYDKKLAGLVIHLDGAQRRDKELRYQLGEILKHLPQAQLYQIQTALLAVLTFAALIAAWFLTFPAK